MRAIWKGAVSFGLVSVPVKLYSATESHDVSFRQVHASDGGRIKYQRVCAIDGEEVAYADIAKGYETEDGEMVILTDDDLAELPSTSSREIAVEKFVPTDQIDPMLFEKSYYLEPEKSGAKPYALLRQALLDADRMAVVTVALRQRTSVAVLRVRDDVIVLQTMMWPDEIRTPDFSVETGEVKDAEVKMATMLVETLAGDFDATEFEDDYAGAVQDPRQGQDRGRRDQAHPHLHQVLRRGRRPARGPAALGRGRQSGRRESEQDDPDEDSESGSGASRKAPAKKTAAKKSSRGQEDHRQEGQHQEVGGEEVHGKKAAAKKSAAQEVGGEEGQLTRGRFIGRPMNLPRPCGQRRRGSGGAGRGGVGDAPVDARHSTSVSRGATKPSTSPALPAGCSTHRTVLERPHDALGGLLRASRRPPGVRLGGRDHRGAHQTEAHVGEGDVVAVGLTAATRDQVSRAVLEAR